MNITTVKQPHKEQGFTLLELSIVLVIIGLIVGGVLVGQDLIKAAEVRATVGQYEKYNTAINTFRTKYDGIPGDLSVSKVAAFGLTAVAGATGGSEGLGDANGVITDTAGGSTGIGEPLLFWQQMTAAGLVDGSFSVDVTTGGATTGTITGADMGTWVPPARIGRGNYWVVGSSLGTNYYLLSAFDATSALTAAGAYTFNPTMTPVESYNIDVKVDDGLPNAGMVQARGTATDEALFDPIDQTNFAAHNAADVEGNCTTGATTTASRTYSRGPNAGQAPACILRLRFN
jgi:prepilin-type N-terminal cleavage/methylation domain-containing protein